MNSDAEDKKLYPDDGSFNFELIAYEDKKPNKELGEFNFYSRPTIGDLVDVNMASRFDQYRVVGFLHNIVSTESVEAAPNSLAASKRKPKLLLEFIESHTYEVETAKIGKQILSEQGDKTDV